jgi:GGDEF domain-containing protein
MSVITEKRLRRLFRDEGFSVIRVRNNRHWVAEVERTTGGPQFNVVVSRSPSDHRFQQNARRLCERIRKTIRYLDSETVLRAFASILGTAYGDAHADEAELIRDMEMLRDDAVAVFRSCNKSGET